MGSFSRGFGGVTTGVKQLAYGLMPVIAIGIASANQASATTACDTPVLSLISQQVISGTPADGLGCFANPSLPGLTLYTTGPISAVGSETKTFEAQWIVAYTGAGPASSSVSYDVIVAGTADQQVRWSLEVQGLPVAGSLFAIGSGGFTEFSDTQAVSPIYPGNYTIDLTATSLGDFTVSAPANTSVDLVNPVPQGGGVPEPASIATLGIGLTAGFLFLRKSRKKN